VKAESIRGEANGRRRSENEAGAARSSGNPRREGISGVATDYYYICVLSKLPDFD
jgi:hypothetical protein